MMNVFSFFKTIINSPIRREIYEFTRGTEKFYYTSADIDIQDGETIYEAITLNRSDIESGSALEKNSVEITFALNSKFAQDCLRSALEENILVKISRVQFGNITTLWQGRVVAVQPKGAEITLACETDYTTLGRTGARYKYQRTCVHDVYGIGCGLNKSDWAIETTIVNVDGLNVTLRGLTVVDGYFNLGMLEDSNGVSVSIEESAGQQVALMRRLDTLVDQITTSADLAAYNTAKSELEQAIETRDQFEPETPEYEAAQLVVDEKQLAFDESSELVHIVKVYAGCMKSLRACDDFGNTDNYLAFPYMPEKNPTTTRIV